MEYRDGWYGAEADSMFPFRWMRQRAKLVLSPDELRRGRFLLLPIFSEFMNFSQTLTISASDRVLASFALLHQWSHYSLDLRPGDVALLQGREAVITLTLNKLFPFKFHTGDERELGIRVGQPDFHDDPSRHEDLLFVLENARRLDGEMRLGKTRLESYPPNLGIDIWSKCNITPHCVYCPWDEMKVLEGRAVDIPVDEATIRGYGPFFRSARRLVNCSIGEPLLHPRLADILDLARRGGKFLELSTNGQAFTPRVVKALAGQPVILYISLDAGTRETYAKIRNDRWDLVTDGLGLLAEERRRSGGWPNIFMVFIPMRVNRGDLEPYFRLCRDVGAEALVLRPLLDLADVQPDSFRGGYTFHYADEMLNPEELNVLFAEAEALSRRYRVPVLSQFDFGAVPRRDTANAGSEEGR